MSDELYEDGIVRLAKAAHGAGRLEAPATEAPTAEATVDNPLCGDRVTVQVARADGHIAALRHTVKGCLLCRAAASMLGLHGEGLTKDAVAQNLAALDAMLASGAAPPAEAWPELAVFEPVRRHKSRFECVRLPLQAAAQALSA